MGHDGYLAQKNEGSVSTKKRYTTNLDQAPVTNWKEGVVLRCLQNIKCCTGSVKHAADDHPIVRYESSSSDESMGTVAMQFRIAAERDRRQIYGGTN